MRRRRALGTLGLAASGLCLRPAALRAGDDPPVPPPLPAWKRSDVVFMYEAEPEVYAAYGATVLAWGGRPTPESLRAAEGVAWHGSVGMVTEFGRYHARFPRTWEQGLCRDVHGEPIRVPWLADHRHEGVPFWWCCTRQPQFRLFLEERVADLASAGVAGLHVDDHLGSAGALFLGACFCDRCVPGFRAHLAALPEPDRRRLGAAGAAAFDYGAVLRAWLAGAAEGEARRVQDHALWPEWSIYQLRGAQSVLLELGSLGARVAGRKLPVSANAGLLWPNHLATHRAVDAWSAETDHEAAALRASDRPLLAYRMAEAMGRPYAATATGQDWAFVKESGRSGLVRCWIATAHAAGQVLMAPHRQWCHTEEKGTHWYDGPTPAYAPLYRFVRENAALFEGHETWADLVVVLPHRSWRAQPDRWMAMAEALAAANVSYRLVVGGDEVVDKSVAPAELRSAALVLCPAPADLLPADRELVAALAPAVVVDSAERAVAAARRAARLETDAPVRLLPRVSGDDVVLHVLSRAYEPATDSVRPLEGLSLILDRSALGIPAPVETACVLSPGRAPRDVALGADGRLSIDLDLWALVRIARRA